MDGPMLPAGWRFKLTSQGKYFLTPDMKTLLGERAALEELVARGSSREDVAKMLELMTTLGWSRSTHLPAGWIFTRKFNLTQVVLVSEAGQVFEVSEAPLLTPSVDSPHPHLAAPTLLPFFHSCHFALRCRQFSPRQGFVHLRLFCYLWHSLLSSGGSNTLYYKHYKL